MSALKSILTVALNPAIDKIVTISDFRLAIENRTNHLVTYAAGKGINVARTLKFLGLPSLVVGFAGGANGQNLLRALLLENLEHNFVFIQDETRINLTVQDPESEKLTRILEPGPRIDKKDLASFRHKFSRLAKAHQWIVIAGRGVRGAPHNFYQELVEIAGKAGSKVIVDAADLDLAYALKGKPFLVKVNREEAQVFLKQKLASSLQLKVALKKFLSLGAQVAIISLGARGAVAFDGKVFLVATCPKVKVVNRANLVGCGDALTAGFIFALEQKKTFADALAVAVAAGTANILSNVPGQISRRHVDRILQKVIVKNL